MTIDEAIAHAKEVAEDNRNNLKYAPFTQEECIKCAEEHDQLAKWLEELKAIKESAVFYSNRPIEDIVLEARADAIEECMQIVKDYSSALVGTYYYNLFIDKKEQLKEQK